jgi:hypothetical protein
VQTPSSLHYKWWCDFVLLTLRCYALDDHVLSNITDLSSIDWPRLDNIVVTWILRTLSPKLHEIIQESMETARQAWLTLEAEFLGNRESRVLQHDARFHVFKQRDHSISNHFRQMKGMVDELCALGETVTDHHLILNLL